MRAAIEAIFHESAEVKAAFLSQHAATLEAVIRETVRVLHSGQKLLFFGNGGSAADAQHLAAEFVNRFAFERPALPALALTTDTSILTSVGNDRGYDAVFARQIEALGCAGDMAFALSTSGASPNVLLGVEVARAKGLVTVGLTGGGGGKLSSLVDYVLSVPSRSTPRIQEVHITVGHTICALVEELLFPDRSAR